MEVLLILIVTALNCHLIGHILVIKNESMLADALSHSILLGIVLGFFIVQRLDSPVLVLFAAIFGVLTILLIDRLNQSQKVNHDTATGLVFPFFFALAVILITMFANNVHLDMDMVLMGEIIFAPLTRVDVLGFSISSTLLKVVINAIIIAVLLVIVYEPLKLYLSDVTHAILSGVKTTMLSLVIMVVVALTTVMSFDSVGSISVIAFFVAPSLAVLRGVKHYGQFLAFSSIVSVFICIAGYFLAMWLDLTIAGTTTMMALVFAIGVPLFLKKVNKH